MAKTIAYLRVSTDQQDLNNQKHEIEAYRDFCAYRDRLTEEQGHAAKVSREGWLDARRNELQSRMRRRRKRSSKSPFSA